MKFAAACFIPVLALAVQPPPATETTTKTQDAWSSLKRLAGNWEAGGANRFSLVEDLQGKAYVRRNHAEYPGVVHDDLMIVYREGDRVRADYYDNEGHVIRYTVDGGDEIRMVSDVTAGAPRYRLTYYFSVQDKVDIRFEIAPPGQAEAFKLYLAGTARRLK